jgi:hypothetical protein
MPETLTIDARFNGPPESGNGGYTCGRLAAFVDAPAAEVTLRLPPPIGREMRVERAGDGTVALLDGEALVAEARPTEVAAEAPRPVDARDAAEAEADSAFLDSETHPFPTCFVCGPKRHAGDGLRIFAAPIPERDVYGASWTPDPALGDPDGNVPAELVWAALDCPTSAPIANDWNQPGFLPIVLARYATRILAPARAGEPHTIVCWPIELDGRKRHAGAALHNEAGELVAVARALWIELKPTA